MRKNNLPWYKNNNLLLGIGIGGIVIVLGILFTLNRALSATDTTSTVPTAAAAQEISMRVTGGAYMPSSLTVPAGKQIKWTVDGTQASGCTTYLLAPELGISKKLNKGTNVIEFTAPTQKGSYGFQCSMGMVKGTLNVV
jgi:plastocyanin domain-containing protein